jgi:hypothetical protein
MTLASFQLPGLACFGGAFLSLILPNAWGLEGVTDFLIEATLMVASSSAATLRESIVARAEQRPCYQKIGRIHKFRLQENCESVIMGE